VVGPKHELRAEPQGRLLEAGTRVCGFSRPGLWLSSLYNNSRRGGGVFPSLTNFSLFELLFFLIVLGTMLTRIPVIAEVIHLSLVFTGKIGLK
jgi:hypothetical protein